MTGAPSELRVLLLPVGGTLDPWDLLLPQGAVAELVRLGPVQAPGPRAPDWLCGSLPWRGLRLPLVRPVPLAALPRGGYAAVCLAPSGSTAAPFFAVESPGMPRLERITPETLTPDARAGAQARGHFIQTALRVRDRPAGLLDLDAIERALAGAAG